MTTTNIVERYARRYVVQPALALDIASLIIRFLITGAQLVLPALYMAWQRNAAAWDAANIIVLIGNALGVAAAWLLAFPAQARVHRLIDAASKISNRQRRKERVAWLERKGARMAGLVRWSIAPAVGIGASLFLSGMHITGLEWITAAVDIGTPIVSYYVITNASEEADAVDAQEEAMSAASRVVVGQLSIVGAKVGADMTRHDAAFLQAGADGDINGMIEAVTPRDSGETYYTISEICRRYGIDESRDSRDRKRIYRLIMAARPDYPEIRRDRRAGWLVPSALMDRLFGDLVTDLARRTTATAQTAIGVQPARADDPDGPQSNMIQFPMAR